MSEMSRVPNMTWALEIRDEVVQKLRDRGMTGAAEKIARTKIIFSGRLTRTAGLAYYARCLVKLSSYFFSRPENFGQFRETTLHELAHIAAPGGHHAEWRNLLISLGGSGARCHSMTSAGNVKIGEVSCPCGKTVQTLTPRIMKRYRGVTFRATNCCNGLFSIPVSLEALRPAANAAVAEIPAAVARKVEKKDGSNLDPAEIFRILKEESGSEGITASALGKRTNYWHNTILKMLNEEYDNGHPYLVRYRDGRSTKWSWDGISEKRDEDEREEEV